MKKQKILMLGFCAFWRGNKKANAEWIRCSVCGNKTRLRMREDAKHKSFPLYCHKCKKEMIVNAKQMNRTVVKAPDAKPQS